MKIAYITDSSAGLSIDDLAKLQIFSLPLQIIEGTKSYFDLENFSIDDCLELLKQEKTLKTSLPSLGLIEELISKIKDKGFTKVVAVPICKGLSGTYNAIVTTCRQYDIECVIFDTGTTSYFQLDLIKYLKKIYEVENDDEIIKQKVDDYIKSTQTLIIPSDMQHLKRGGRLTPFAATLASILRIKPILEVNLKHHGKIDVLDKVRTFNKAIDTAIKKHMIPNIEDGYKIVITHVDCEDKAKVVKEKILKHIGNDVEIEIHPLCTPVSCHVGLDSIAIQYYKKFRV